MYITTEWPPKTLFNVGESILCPVTYYVSRIYKERINAFPTLMPSKNAINKTNLGFYAVTFYLVG